VVGVLGHGGQALVDQRRGAGERVLLPQDLGLVLVGDDRRQLMADGVEPAAKERRQESAIGSRTSSGSPSWASSRPRPATNCSHANRSSWACSIGAVPTSMASHDLELIFLQF
jgi:hypothetical protein